MEESAELKVDEKGLAKLQEVDQVIATITPYMALTINGVEDREGLKAVHDARMEVKQIRINVERSRKELKASALEFGRRVDAEAKRVTALITPIEKHLEDQEFAIEAEKERIKAAKLEAERAALNERLEKLAQVGATINPLEVQSMSHETFESVLVERTELFEAEIAKKLAEQQAREAEEARIAAERAKMEAERAELERMRAEQEAAAKAQREAQEIIERGRLARIAAEEREREQIARAAEEARLAKIAAEDRERARIAAEAKAEQERIAAELERQRKEVEAEKERLRWEEVERVRKVKEAEDAAREAEIERREAEERKAAAERAERLDRAKAAAEAPDRALLRAYCKQLLDVPTPGVESERIARIRDELTFNLTNLVDGVLSKL